MKNYKKDLKAALITGLGYGVGFVVGVVLIRLLFDIGLLDSVANYFEKQHLIMGIILLFLVVIAGGAAAGAVGGLSLWFAFALDSWKRPVSRSAFGIGFSFGVVLLPIMGLLAMLAMYNAGNSSPVGFIISMGVIGLIFGFVSGLMTATLPQKGNYWRVTAILTTAFGVGGLAFGFGLWNYFYVLYETGIGTAQLLFSFFVFGSVGGMVMGWIFSRDLDKKEIDDDENDTEQANIFYRTLQWFKSTKFYQKRGFWGTVFFFIIIIILSRLIALSPLNISEATLADSLPLDSTGIHWSSPWIVAESKTLIQQPSVAQSQDLLAVTWVQDDRGFYSFSSQKDRDIRVWKPPTELSVSAESKASVPQAVIDSSGILHIVWLETQIEDPSSTDLVYSTCLDGKCSEAESLYDQVSEDCRTDHDTTPAIAISAADTLMVVWDTSHDDIAFLRWDAVDSARGSEGCALVNWQGRAKNPRVAALWDGDFALVFDNASEIFMGTFDGVNDFQMNFQEAGSMPDIFVDSNGQVHEVWCGPEGQLQHSGDGISTKTIQGSGCINRPVLGQDADGVLHLVWYATQAEQPSGQVIDTHLIYESRLVANAWTDPIIINLSAPEAQPAVTTGSDGLLHLVWAGSQADSGQINYAQYRTYECSPSDLNPQGRLALDVALSGKYRPADDLVPYCHNRFDSLLILPKAEPAYSDNPTTLNGAFDEVAALIQTAHYEVLLSTMWYETDDTGTSPGAVLGEGVKALYDKVKANPGQYPRGMTVRILLGNPPEFTLSNLISQVWNVFNHMRSAGLKTMSDPEIGWKLEIANFDGSWPHGHTKLVVIDGKTAVAAGFNYQHKHQSKDHPSGKGKDDYDLGLQMTGPVAQTTQIAFDDLWSGSHSIVCPELDSVSPLWWISCKRETATAEHVPEVKKLYLATENHNAFALHRTDNFNEADITVPTTVASAQETLDVLQVNFTMKLICDLNLIFKVCDFRDALSYMQAMMQTIESNRVKTRVLIKPGPIEAVESNIAVEAFRDELAARGLSDLVEFRYFQDSVHAKAVLIDEQFLLVGSQNFHYSAYGEGGLTEFNIGTDDPEAIADFKRFFEYHWERAEPIPIKE